MAQDYNPNELLAQILDRPLALDELPQLLNHTHQYKKQLNREIEQLLANYKSPHNLNDDIVNLVSTLRKTKTKAASTQQNILSMTKSIQDLDSYKKNLVLSMKILKRLQMLIIANNNLNAIIQSRNYKDILSYFSVVKELLGYFRPYRSIDEINQLTLSISKTQNKLIDDIFIDFEESFTNKFTNNQLIYGCEIIELISDKYKDKLLTWFYNHQLKEIKSIFNNLDEAGNIENVNRRYIYFNNVLKSIQSNYLGVFPKSWQIDLELSKLFCKLTNQNLTNQLAHTQVADSALLLECLHKTLEFEKGLNDTFRTTDFDKIISLLFEPYLTIWIKEQDRMLSSKFIEFYQTPKIPPEFVASTSDLNEFLTVLKVNNVPNIASSSVELFRTFSKILTQIVKLTNGAILVDVTNLFSKYLHEYYQKHLLPIINQSVVTNSANSAENIESIKYLTMVLNTADYIINNTNDLEAKIIALVGEPHKDKVSLRECHEWYYELISKSINNLLQNINGCLQFAWRQFENNSWNSMENTADILTYMVDFQHTIHDNVKIILPLVLREGYIRNFADKLVEMVVVAFMNHLKVIKPLSIINIEQIMVDLKHLKAYIHTIPLYSDPNLDQKDADKGEVSKFYTRVVNTQFNKIETLLKLLLTPTLPVDNLIGNYFQMIGDRSTANLRRILNLKDIDRAHQQKYLDNFNLQLTMSNELVDESPLLSGLQDDYESTHEPTEPKDIRDSLSKSPEPALPDFFKSKSPKILGNNTLKINNIEKNLRELALNGETQVNKFNENFKNFGKFFRKDND